LDYRIRFSPNRAALLVTIQYHCKMSDWYIT